MKYAEVFKDEVVRIYDSLPISWKNVSNFDALSEEHRLDLNWAGYPDTSFLPVYEKTVLPIDENTFDTIDGVAEYNRSTHTLIGPMIEVLADKVITTWELIEKSQEELLQVIRKKRDSLLKASDWSQQPDVPLSEEKRNEWRIYRQQLRDLTNGDLLELLDDPFYNNWPQKPE